MADLNKYLSLITSEHSDKPIYVAAVSASVSPLVDIQTVAQTMPELFNLDDAVGDQLDALGAWVGASRNVSVPLTGVYFSWRDTSITGWRSGTWKGTFDPVSGLVSLPDDAYRLLIRAKIAANHWDGTIPGAYSIWDNLFGASSIILIQDNQDMSMVVGVAGTPLGAIERVLLTGGYIPLKPEGVRINYYAVVPSGGPIFGWRTNTPALQGWRSGSWATRL